MNNKLIIRGVISILSAISLVACNSSDSSSGYELTDMQSLAVTGFKLQNNSKVLNNLDSVFFSIDLNKALIFNADSLPYGTDVSALAVTVATASCSQLKIFSKTVDEEGVLQEKTIDYIENSNAKINFSNGAVKLHIVSSDGEYSRDYFISVNVHKVVPDSLFWSEMARASLPTLFSRPVQQKAVAFGGKALCLSTDGHSYSLATSGNLFDNVWNSESVSFPSEVDVRSFTATDNSLYILAADGTLLESADGIAWSATGRNWRSIAAVYGDNVTGVSTASGTFRLEQYPSGAEMAMPDGFPVSGMSATVGMKTKWSSNPYIMIVGGVQANGELSAATWAYDGTSWARIGNGLPAAEGYSLIKYTITETDTVSWRVKESEILLAMGGKQQLGLNRNVYVSRDLGITWKKGGTLLQLPEYMPSVFNADLLAFTTEMSAMAQAGAPKRSASWTECHVKQPWLQVQPCHGSRVASATEEWDCPFLYMFGGVDGDGVLQNALWRGVVNHFTFRPLE